MSISSFGQVEEALQRRDAARKDQAKKIWGAINAFVDQVSQRIEAVEHRVAALEEDQSTPAPPIDLSGIEGRIQALEAGEGPSLAAHLEQEDPHGDRAYARSLSSGSTP